MNKWEKFSDDLQDIDEVPVILAWIGLILFVVWKAI